VVSARSALKGIEKLRATGSAAYKPMADDRRSKLERDRLFVNRSGIPKGLRVRFKMLAGKEAGMYGASVFTGSS
jgi:hypothetical protein